MNVLAARAQNLLQGRNVESLSRLDQGFRLLAWAVELFLTFAAASLRGRLSFAAGAAARQAAGIRRSATADQEDLRSHD